MSVFDWARIEWLDLSVSPSCVGGFGTRLSVKAGAPLAFLAALVGLAGVVGALHKEVAGDQSRESRASVVVTGARAFRYEAARDGICDVLPFVLVALFTLVPSISTAAFGTFSCEQFDLDDVGTRVYFMYADPSIQCNTGRHAQLKLLAGFLIALWPVGVPCLFAALMLASRSRSRKMASRKASWAVTLSRSISFLHAEYRDEYWFWEYARSELNPPNLSLGALLLVWPSGCAPTSPLTSLPPCGLCHVRTG